MLHIYVLVREDLPFSHQAVQATHAAIAMARDSLIPSDLQHPNLVVLTVPNEKTLKLMSLRLRGLGIEHRTFEEADMNNELTALATEPVQPEQRRHFRKFSLLRGPELAEAAA